LDYGIHSQGDTLEEFRAMWQAARNKVLSSLEQMPKGIAETGINDAGYKL